MMHGQKNIKLFFGWKNQEERYGIAWVTWKREVRCTQIFRAESWEKETTEKM